jgi:Zn finger protein HypA/HybF involved in hydrogenase expression
MTAVIETADERGGKVRSFRVGVGELAQFDIRLIKQLIEDLKKGTPLEGAEAVVEKEKSRVKCLSCGKEWDFQRLASQLSADEKEMVHFLPELLNSCSRCPSCSKSYFDIEAGRSVRVVEVVLDV